MIGHGLIHIFPHQLKIFVALLYKMITIDDIINCYKKPSSSDFSENLYYKQKTKCHNNTIKTQYFPTIRGTTSMVLFWVNRLRLMEIDELSNFDDIGYSSPQEMLADLKGIYDGPYAKPNGLYVHIYLYTFMYHLCIIYVSFIYIYIYIYI